MPAIDAALPTPTIASSELRTGSQTPASSAKSGATDSQGSEAFIAALLAQGSMPPVDPAVPLAVTENAALLAGGQELPTMCRPLPPPVRRVVLSARCSQTTRQRPLAPLQWR